MPVTPETKEAGYADCIAGCYPELSAEADIVADLASKMPQGSLSEKISMAKVAGIARSSVILPPPGQKQAIDGSGNPLFDGSGNPVFVSI